MNSRVARAARALSLWRTSISACDRDASSSASVIDAPIDSETCEKNKLEGRRIKPSIKPVLAETDLLRYSK